MLDFPPKWDEAERRVLTQFKLDVYGAHGIHHWRRVLRNGLEIGPTVGADLEVVTAFALLHDACRTNEYDDPMHGLRGARFARMLWEDGLLPDIDGRQLIQLTAAIIDHHRGLIVLPELEPTIATCWDADRLDLPRVGIKPDPSLLSTEYAKQPEVIERVWNEAFEEDTIA